MSEDTLKNGYAEDDDFEVLAQVDIEVPESIPPMEGDNPAEALKEIEEEISNVALQPTPRRIPLSEDLLGSYLILEALDNKGAGGANHHYVVKDGRHQGNFGKEREVFAEVKFQNGGIQNPQTDINGASNEALLAIVIDRLRGFMDGPFPSRETAVALTHIETALLWLEKRTSDRKKRGVEGKHIK